MFRKWQFHIIAVQVLLFQGYSLVAPCHEGFHVTDAGFCCRQIKCPRDYQFHLCQENNGNDACTPCKEGTINPDPIETNSFSYQLDGLCIQPDCSCAPEAKLMNPNECRKTGKKKCDCNLEHSFYGEDSLNCRKANPAKQKCAKRKGFELTQKGFVRECQSGYFKSEDDSSICRPHTSCPKGRSVEVNGTRFHDTRCKIDDQAESTSPIPSTFPNSTTADTGQSTFDVEVFLGVVIPVIFLICLVIVFAYHCVKHQWYKKFTCFPRKENGMAERDEETELSDRQNPPVLLPKELDSSDSEESVGNSLDFDTLLEKENQVDSLQQSIPQEIVKDIRRPKNKTNLMQEFEERGVDSQPTSVPSEAPVDNRSETTDLPDVVGGSLKFSMFSEKDSQADSVMTSGVSTMPLQTFTFPHGNDVESLISEGSVDQGLGASRQFRKKPIQKVSPMQFQKNSNDTEASGNNDEDEDQTESKEYM
ncbi:tumor necrosis factor receptor superfamily member 10D-like [Ostrea edulis]|uniref:tumor necrosis factor receptor superfamily member 10D-like n=1 Tax=Ostrea edulis TaxID=37623 RepID=UPI0024AF3B60|nr:tumor necrosis factor receptor superfamily member 10D-like [Ostrea edulis]